MNLLIDVLIFFSVFLLIYSFEKRISLKREEDLLKPEKKPAPQQLGIYKIFGPLEGVVAKLGMPLDFLKHRLEMAGSFINIGEFLGFKILSTAALFITALILFKSKPLFILIAGAIGFIYPDFWLKKKIARRHFEISRDLPQIIDILVLCIDAGLDFVMAISRVVGEFKKCPINDELNRVLSEIKMGKQRNEALAAMAKRIDMVEVSSFVRTLVQAEKMGSPVIDILRIKAEELRMRRFARGEELALAAPVKLLFPLVAFILPVVLIIVGGPILLQFMRGGIKF